MNERDYRSATQLAKTAVKKIIPAVNEELHYWQTRAEKIPNPNLRKQALQSIEAKAFHARGGGIYAMLAKDKWREAITFIVAYQTISDYLDNLCDRSDSLDPIDFRSLHQSMLSIFNLSNETINYYRYRQDQDDGGYLDELVRACQKQLRQLPDYGLIQEQLLELAMKYIDLQVDKHVLPEDRVERLIKSFENNSLSDRSITWYEYSAATGSTLAIFCLISYAYQKDRLSATIISDIYQGYFPYIQGLHILLDYLIDQEEDRLENDLNFCFYYPSHEKMEQRIVYFIDQSKKSVRHLPDDHFHRYIYEGLLALYLADPKVHTIKDGQRLKRRLLKVGGYRARFFHWGIRFLNRHIKTTDQIF
ncbi:MAG: tetraprenyl-beta-curcumene synthase family protein [Amphibacillus sp.]|nr:tetraprenyl-beta-curcumene synthase family protein [Amphibacillus sp.]